MSNARDVYTINESSLRPYNVGTFKRSGNLASITLYNENKDKNSFTEAVVIPNYFKDLSTRVDGIISDATTEDVGVSISGSPPSGTIPTLSLNNVDDYYAVFNNFSLMAVNEAHDEIVKIHQNLNNSWNAFFFGEKPTLYKYSGVFIDTPDYPYYQEFMTAYNKYLVGRKCVENKMRLVISYDGKIVDGFIINIRNTSTAESNEKKDFAFVILVKGVSWVRNNLIAVKQQDGTVRLKSGYNVTNNKYRMEAVFQE